MLRNLYQQVWRSLHMGKVWNLPNTVIGLMWGATSLPFGAHVIVGNNAVQFTNHSFMLPGSAITIGNTTSYASDVHPGTPLGNGYMLGDHERQHTFQGEQLGPTYLLSNLLGGALGILKDGDWHGPANWNERGPQAKPPRPW